MIFLSRLGLMGAKDGHRHFFFLALAFFAREIVTWTLFSVLPNIAAISLGENPTAFRLVILSPSSPTSLTKYNANSLAMRPTSMLKEFSLAGSVFDFDFWTT